MLPPTVESVTSVKAPPFMFGEDTSRTNPSQYVPPLNSVSKLFRKLNVAEAEVTIISRLSRYLSLIPSWSVTKTSLGAVSGPMVEVAHMSGSPEPFDAVQPAGRAGAVTPSKFSMHAGCGDGVGLDGGVGVGVTPGGVGLVVTPGGVGLGVPPGGVGVGVPPGGVGVGVPLGGVGEGPGVAPPRS